MVRKFLYILLALLILLVIAVLMLGPQLRVANSYAAKNACSCFYNAGRNMASIKAQDLSFFPMNLLKLQNDQKRKKVVSSFLGLFKAKAQFKEGLGCSLIHGEDDYSVRFITEKPTTQYLSDSLPWPYGKTEVQHSMQDLNVKHLEKGFEMAFDTEGEWKKKTRALVVVHRDTLVMEKYSTGFDKDTPILGWSMTKSITNALIGILVKKGKLRLEEKRLFEEWKNDKRENITLNNLLQMSSGIRWDEDYNSISNATKTLFLEEDAVRYVTGLDLEYEPGSYWEYSSGSTNLLSGIIRNQFNQLIQYQAFPYLELFNKIGMESAQLECDESGNYILSSFGYATPRDWAKLGMLYLNNGRWKDMEILNEEFIDYSLSPAPACKSGIYGAQIWLNTDYNSFKDAPEDLYYFSGYQGQYVCVIPSKDVVIVRMGLSNNEEFDFNALLSEILKAFQDEII